MADIVFDPTGSPENFAAHLKALSTKNASVLIFACDGNRFEKAILDPLLLESSATVLGAVFPSIIYNARKYERGTLFIALDDEMESRIIEDISKIDQDRLDADMQEKSVGFDLSSNTMFLFIDGLAKNIGACINALFDYHGPDINYIGGGSGSLSLEQKPSLFTNQGLLKDAFVYACSKRRSAIGVSHGWKSVSGPYQVTRSAPGIIRELDYRPAFEVYKDVVDGFSTEPIGKENFFSVAKSFPFGINRISDEKVMRDLIVLDGTGMVCIGDVEEGSYVDILQGSRDDLIEAARNAADVSHRKMDFENDFTLFIDCISRVLFLEEKFDSEIEAVYRSGTPLIGALTFGEIANGGGGYLEFYNKTAVVGHIGHG